MNSYCLSINASESSSLLGRRIFAYISKAWAALVRVVRVKWENIYYIFYMGLIILSRIIFRNTRTTRTTCGILRPFQGLSERPSADDYSDDSDGLDIAASVVVRRALEACLIGVEGVSSKAMTTKRDRSPKTRARRLRLHPLCAECLKAGVTKATEEIDHVVPLEQGGPDTDDNTQGLCTYHNRMKRNAESYGHVTYGLDGWPVEDE